MNANKTNVKKMRPSGWADFKHKLFRAGILLTPTDTVPLNWQTAYKQAFGYLPNAGR